MEIKLLLLVEEDLITNNEILLKSKTFDYNINFISGILTMILLDIIIECQI